MTQKDKELSFIDISGRLHYGVIVNYKENEYDHRKWKITNLHTLSYSKSGTLIDTDYDGWISYEEHKGCGMSTGSRPFRFGEVLPYLRQMSSMTEEEFVYFMSIRGMNLRSYEIQEMMSENFRYPNRMAIVNTLGRYSNNIDWLNKNMFDYRGLIPMGLAIEVTEDNNPYKE